MRTALTRLPPPDVVRLVESQGVPTKVEHTGKVFPVSDRAIDVRDAFVDLCKINGAEIQLQQGVVSINKVDEYFHVRTESHSFRAQRLVIACGGKSYPGCGTTGDGYAWAKQFGHSIVNPVPALTPITTQSDWIRQLKGITIDDVEIGVVEPAKIKADGNYRPKDFLKNRRSGILLTHFGLSGPSVLDVSRAVTNHQTPKHLKLICNFLPDHNVESIRELIAKQMSRHGAKQIDSLINELVPSRLSKVLLENSAVSPSQKSGEISKAQLREISKQLCATEIPISGTLGFKKAEVTAGGVHLKEIDPRSMQSKLVPGLFFVGEVLDIDGPIGGFNFQAAFSTGWLAAENLD